MQHLILLPVLTTAVALALVLVSGVCRAWAYLTRKDAHWGFHLAWNLGTGHHLDGKRRTDRGAFRWGTASIKGDQHHASWLSLVPRFHRAGALWGTIVLAPSVLAGWLAFPMLTAALLGMVGWLLMMWTLRRVWAWAHIRGHKRDVEAPAALQLAPVLRIAPKAAKRAVAITPRYTAASSRDVLAEVKLPKHFQALPKQRQMVQEILGAKLPVDVSWEWDTLRHPARLRALCTSAPPKEVLAGDWLGYMDSLAHGVYFLGAEIDADPIVWNARHQDPMMAINARTRTGKTNQKLAIVVQALRRGERVTVVDPKRVSFLCLQGVPGFTLLNDPDDVAGMVAGIHQVRVRMDQAVREYGLGRSAEVTPELLVMEEANWCRDMFRDWWEAHPQGPRQTKGVRISDCPPWADIRSILYGGAQFGFTVIASGQDIKDATVFGASASFGTILMGGFKESQWSTLIGTRPVPPCPKIKGRFAFCQGGQHTWYQAVCADPSSGDHNERAWRLLALNGREEEAPQPTQPIRVLSVTIMRPKPRPRREPVGSLHRGAGERLAIGSPSDLIVGIQAGADYLGIARGTFVKQLQRHGRPVGEGHARRGARIAPCWSPESLDRWLNSIPHKTKTKVDA